MLVSDWMTRELVTVAPETEVSEALELMLYKGIRRLPVVRDRELLGFITLGDIREAEGGKSSFVDWDSMDETATMPVSRIMSSKPYQISPDATLEDAAQMMRETKVGSLPVVDSFGNLVGIITQADMMLAFCRMLGSGVPGKRLTLTVESGEDIPRLLHVIESHGAITNSLAAAVPVTGAENRISVVLRIETGDMDDLLGKLEECGCRIVDVR
ncbi:MAG TPA: CBS domain-containing protein [Candidatus Brocadiia bacterium]|nr:CBS domain-containing protein [Candidatus Brocadiia bacterium]